MERDASVPEYRKWRPGGRLVIPWKLGEEEKVDRLMPMNVLGGREWKRSVPVLEAVVCDMLGFRASRGLFIYTIMKSSSIFER